MTVQRIGIAREKTTTGETIAFLALRRNLSHRQLGSQSVSFVTMVNKSPGAIKHRAEALACNIDWSS